MIKLKFLSNPNKRRFKIKKKRSAEDIGRELVDLLGRKKALKMAQSQKGENWTDVVLFLKTMSDS